MTHSVSNLHEAQTVMVGVDTHKHMHVAVAIDSRGIIRCLKRFLAREIYQRVMRDFRTRQQLSEAS